MKVETDKSFNQLFGKRLAQRRHQLKLTQAQVAERVELDVETISRFERGKCLPSIATCSRLAAALFTTIGQLVDENIEIEQTIHQELIHSLSLLDHDELLIANNILKDVIAIFLNQKINRINIYRQDKTRQDKTRQDKTRQDKTRQDN